MWEEGKVLFILFGWSRLYQALKNSLWEQYYVGVHTASHAQAAPRRDTARLCSSCSCWARGAALWLQDQHVLHRSSVVKQRMLQGIAAIASCSSGAQQLRLQSHSKLLLRQHNCYREAGSRQLRHSPHSCLSTTSRSGPHALAPAGQGSAEAHPGG